MNFSKDTIENFVYRKTWIKYRLYSSDCYRLYLDSGIYFILNHKDNYITGKSDFMLQIYVEPGHCVYTIRNLNINVKQLKYDTLEQHVSQYIDITSIRSENYE